MPQYVQFDEQDLRALQALDDFTISTNGETATVAGEMQVAITRFAEDGGARYRLSVTFPNGEKLEVRIARAQLLQELNINVDES